MFPRINSLWHALLDLLFPRKPLIQELERMDASEFAARAGRAPNFAGKEMLSCFDYRDKLVRQAIFELKYRGNKKIAKLLATALYDELLAFLEEYAPLTNFTEPLLVPIPLSRKRESERGFNQCRLLVDELMRLDSPSSSPPFQGGVPSLLARASFARQNLFGRGGVVALQNSVIGRNFTLSLALQKTKDTESQTKQDTRAKRLENLKGCFVADGNIVKGRNIILIDDVATTGATLEEARRTLRRAGARKVIAFTVAH